MNIRYLSAIAATCVLAACQSTTTTPAQPQIPTQPTITTPPVTQTTPNLKPQRFECKNGMTVNVKYVGNDTVSVAVDTIGSEVKLTQAVSGSGERYVNNKGFYNKTTEWHQKGNLGHLTFTDPYGNTVEASCAVK